MRFSPQNNNKKSNYSLFQILFNKTLKKNNQAKKFCKTIIFQSNRKKNVIFQKRVLKRFNNKLSLKKAALNKNQTLTLRVLVKWKAALIGRPNKVTKKISKKNNKDIPLKRNNMNSIMPLTKTVKSVNNLNFLQIA